MFLERLLFLITGAIVFVCLGFALVMIASGPEKGSQNKAAVQPQANVAKAQKPAAAPSPASPPSPVAPGAAKAPEPTFDRVISTAPEYARFFNRLHEAFPADYAATVQSWKTRAAAGGPEESPDFYVSEAVRLLRQSRGSLAAKAEAAELEKIFAIQLEILRAVAKDDPRICVTFLYGGADRDFARFASGRRPLVGKMALAGLEAIASGQVRRIDRAAPSDADFQALETALAAKGLNKAEIDALLDGKTPDPPIADARMCAAGQIYLETLHDLPEPARMRIYGLVAELMAKS
ncbi:hypothetical protein H2LOC_017935 [Methylocystis heyeri]|uniref:Uncharacterized protein n=2 Tax=Methylocystis heyeri TaxID=391905 RepID=A0A6B8KKG6_9HYPH|nr:hypothetical protein H2LOC_017935 [Methylocystis heyeri]